MLNKPAPLGPIRFRSMVRFSCWPLTAWKLGSHCKSPLHCWKRRMMAPAPMSTGFDLIDCFVAGVKAPALDDPLLGSIVRVFLTLRSTTTLHLQVLPGDSVAVCGSCSRRILQPGVAQNLRLSACSAVREPIPPRWPGYAPENTAVPPARCPASNPRSRASPCRPSAGNFRGSPGVAPSSRVWQQRIDPLDRHLALLGIDRITVLRGATGHVVVIPAIEFSASSTSASAAASGRDVALARLERSAFWQTPFTAWPG